MAMQWQTQGHKASALRNRADAALLCAQADVLEGKDPSGSYEQAAELYRLYAEAQIHAARLAMENK